MTYLAVTVSLAPSKIQARPGYGTIHSSSHKRDPLCKRRHNSIVQLQALGLPQYVSEDDIQSWTMFSYLLEVARLQNASYRKWNYAISIGPQSTPGPFVALIFPCGRSTIATAVSIHLWGCTVTSSAATSSPSPQHRSWPSFGQHLYRFSLCLVFAAFPNQLIAKNRGTFITRDLASQSKGLER